MKIAHVCPYYTPTICGVKQVVYELAQRQLKEKGRQSAFIHFSYVYPLAREKITALFRKDKNYVLVENNSTGQFGTLLRSETGIEINKKILRYDGRPITAEYIISNLK